MQADEVDRGRGERVLQGHLGQAAVAGSAHPAGGDRLVDGALGARADGVFCLPGLGGLLCTGAVLIVVVVTKFRAGAWIAILAMGFLFIVMKLIHKHYDTVSRELEARAAEEGVRISAVGPRAVRLVTHLDVTRADAERAASVLATL